MSRTMNSIRNMKYAIIGQAIGLLVSFISRMVFVRTLSAEYLGLNGLFTNLLSLLSLAELGVGSAIVYSMYEPLADKDYYKINSLMKLYKKFYTIIGIIVALLGFSLAPFLSHLVKELPDLPNMKIIYILFVINSSISYFFTYKRSLIIADQKGYIATYFRYGFYFLLNLSQILALVLTKNYILFLGLQISSTLLENVVVSRKAEKLYPFLKENNVSKLSKDEKNRIIKNVKAMFLHKIGSIAVLGTDSIIISKYVGIIQVGLYSNYLLIINALNTVFGLFFQSIIASIGNLGVTESNEKKKYIFEAINLFNFWVYGFASICLLILFNPFIHLWLGKEYLFKQSLVLIIVISFYLTGMRKSVLTYRDALGLFWYDRYKALFEAIINLIVSIILVQYIGISGVFIGTIFSTLTTCFWVEPYILFKYGFGESVKPYFKQYGYYTGILLAASVSTWLASSYFSNSTIIGFIGKLIICGIFPNAIFLSVFWKSEEFQYLFERIIKNFR